MGDGCWESFFLIDGFNNILKGISFVVLKAHFVWGVYMSGPLLKSRFDAKFGIDHRHV